MDSSGTSAIALPLASYRARFVATTAVSLPPYAGSTWRGALGHALKRAVCITRLPACPECLLYRSCAYSYVFETPPPLGTNRLRKYPAAPHPFVLDLLPEPARIEPGATHRLGFTLIGRANDRLAYFAWALDNAAQQGLGRGGGGLRMEALEQEATPGSGDWQRIWSRDARLEPLPPASPALPAMPQAFTIRLATPLRLKGEGEPVRPEDFGFGSFFSHLLRRISLLAYFHTGRELEADFAGLTRQAHLVSLRDARLDWCELKRYSNRQGRHVPMGGITGSFALEGAQARPFWPVLWLGRFVHAGAATVMGLGAYDIETASLQHAGHAGAPD
ncbi:MAG TPA: CRISPR-associated protein Cas6 [Rhodocyclaceae bacterium]|nr:MAG: CRISPR-associated protein Cas6 [Rhodocyclales bacterium CG_4_10_14_3_um_filter_68_10]PJA57548.1 MAG: CRISPR-associated protein Cas6 [Rhodocyclales bacterium CG_4_9_14_3_um_filter_68_10]HCX34723.1 CRISPR-associated protein Cas6 [Rhodocyclaceae bacterium]